MLCSNISNHLSLYSEKKGVEWIYDTTGATYSILYAECERVCLVPCVPYCIKIKIKKKRGKKEEQRRKIKKGPIFIRRTNRCRFSSPQLPSHTHTHTHILNTLYSMLRTESLITSINDKRYSILDTRTRNQLYEYIILYTYIQILNSYP